MNSVGLITHSAWTFLHKLVPYRECQCATLPVAESLERRIINLPSSAELV